MQSKQRTSSMRSNSFRPSSMPISSPTASPSSKDRNSTSSWSSALVETSTNSSSSRRNSMEVENCKKRKSSTGPHRSHSPSFTCMINVSCTAISKHPTSSSLMTASSLEILEFRRCWMRRWTWQARVLEPPTICHPNNTATNHIPINRTAYAIQRYLGIRVYPL